MPASTSEPVAEGKRLFQAKTVLLDAKAGYRAEPDELEAEVGLTPPEAGA